MYVCVFGVGEGEGVRGGEDMYSHTSNLLIGIYTPKFGRGGGGWGNSFKKGIYSKGKKIAII